MNNYGIGISNSCAQTHNSYMGQAGCALNIQGFGLLMSIDVPVCCFSYALSTSVSEFVIMLLPICERHWSFRNSLSKVFLNHCSAVFVFYLF